MASLRLLKFTIAFGVSLSLCSLSAHAADWYVDGVNGADTNTGASTLTPWKTITHALATLTASASAETIHVAAGLYDAAHGETFPLDVRNLEQIVGDAGALVTTVTANGTSGYTGVAFRISAETSLNPSGVSAATVLSGMTLKGCIVGVGLYAGPTACDPVLRDLVVQDCTVGVGVYMAPTGGAPSASASPQIERVRFVRVATATTVLGIGVSVGPAGSVIAPNAGVVRVSDSTFDGCSQAMSVGGSERTATAEVDRCRITNCSSPIEVGGQSSTPGVLGASLVLRDSLFAHNTGVGCLRVRINNSTLSHATVSGCTFASNVGYGLREDGGMVDVANTILWGNGTDLQMFSPSTVRNCDVGSGFYPPPQATIQADPLFVDAANGDYRLRFGSPCMDRADAGTSSAIDLIGTTRPLDGDLDAIRSPDMGAMEFATLRLLGVPALGQQIGIEFHGGIGAQATLYLARAALTPPLFTQYGALYLDTLQLVQLATVITQPNPAYIMRRLIPNSPLLIGTIYSFQALTDSALAPTGKALTNPVSFVIMP